MKWKIFSYPYGIFLSFSWGVKDLIWLLQFFFKSRVRKWLDHFYRCPNTCVERIYKALLYRTYSLLTLVTLSGSIKKDTWADSTDPRTGYQTTQTLLIFIKVMSLLFYKKIPFKDAKNHLDYLGIRFLLLLSSRDSEAGYSILVCQYLCRLTVSLSTMCFSTACDMVERVNMWHLEWRCAFISVHKWWRLRKALINKVEAFHV